MGGVTLSRWTMSYFAAALLSLIVAECLMAAGYGYPAAAVLAPQTLFLVHVIVIGWLSLLMCGALLQFVPVIVARPLYSDRLALPALLCLVAGLIALLGGFLQLSGSITIGTFVFPLAAGLLGAGFGLILWNLGRTLWAARPLPLSARFVAIGLCCVAATAAFGIIFALVLGGITAAPYFLAITALGLPIHVALGLGGWLTFTAMGVSYRLLAMFMLAPEAEGPTTRAVLLIGALALAVVTLGGLVSIHVYSGLAVVLGFAGFLGVSAIVLYGRDILHLYRARKRRRIELNSRMAGVALVNLGLSVMIAISLFGFGAFERSLAAVIFLFCFGWLSGLGLAKLYKIIAFLTWLECYGPQLGKVATPRVQDLVMEPRAGKWFWLYFMAVWGGAAALLLTWPLLFRMAAALMLVATGGIVSQLVKTRRLAYVAAPLRLPNGARMPRLLVSIV